MKNKTVATESPGRYNIIFLSVCIVFIGLNLRPSMAAIGPMLQMMQNSIDISFVQVSYLTMLPLIAMGVGMFLIDRLSSSLGFYKAIVLGLIFIGVATLSRLYFYQASDLIISSIVSGLGIAIIQALLPGFIKSRVRNAATLIGIYATSIMAGATLSASLTPFLSELMNSWQASLAVWSALTLLGLIAWRWVQSYASETHSQAASAPISTQKPFYRSFRAWQLAVFFGLTTSGYTTILAWLAPYYLDLGYTKQESGLLLSLLTLFEVVAGLLIPYFASKNMDRRKWLVISLLFAAMGLLGLAYMPTQALLLWPMLMGTGIGALFPLSLIVSMDHIANPIQGGRLATFVQGVGYIIAGLSPLAAGYIRSDMDSFQLPWLFLALLMILLIPLALQFNPTKYQNKLALRVFAWND